MALNIKNAEVEALAERLAEAQRTTKTEAVRGALELRLGLVAAQGARPRHRRILEFLEHDVWPYVPEESLGVPTTRSERERILGYGPEGV